MFSALTEIQVFSSPNHAWHSQVSEKAEWCVKIYWITKETIPKFRNGKIPSSSLSFRSFLQNDYEEISLKPTNPDELQDICDNFKEDKAPGYDNITMRSSKSLLIFFLTQLCQS